MPKFEPVRWYAIASAVVALIVGFVPDFPAAGVLALVAAVLGIGEFAVRSSVTPTAKLGEGDPFPQVR